MQKKQIIITLNLVQFKIDSLYKKKMFITHAMNGPKMINKAQTPNRKIKHIITSKNPQLLNNQLNKISSNKKLSLNNKENQHPNIKKSPSQQKDKPTIHIHPNQRVKQNRVKSQYYSSVINTTKQSPIKKILFVKNLCYKSTKTSKNSSLDNKNHQPTSSSQQKYLSLNHNSERNNIFDKQSIEKKSYSNGNKTFMQNQSQIHQQQKVYDRNIQQFRTKDNILQNNESQANYRMTLAPNELHPKMAQFNQKYASYQGQNQSKPNLPRMNSFDCSSSSSISVENNYIKHNNNTKMCPNIQSYDLSQLQSFKKNNFLFPQQKKQTIKALISLDKEKKQSLSSKKRNSRIKINYKNSDRFKQSFNEDLVTQQSEIITISSPSHPIFDDKMKLNNSPNLEFQRDSKSSMSKNTFEESTLIQTKKVNDTYINLSDEFSKITLNESKQSNKEYESEKLHDGKIYCKNHPQKLAKYHLNKKVDKPYYCKKCSANMISLQGCQVIEKFKFCQTERLQKINKFISQIQIIGPKLSKSKINIGAMQQQINLIIKKGQQQIEVYYKKLHETLDQHKQSTIKALHFHLQKTLLQMSKFRKAINYNQQELSFIKSDIIPNIDLIIDQDRLAEQSFKQIIKQHQNKLDSIDALIENISNLMQGKQNKITIKTVQIPSSELKSALNVLERTQIVFIQKIVKINPKQSGSNLSHNMSIGYENQTNDIKKDFSFDDQNIDTSFYVPSSKKKNRNQHVSNVENFYQLTDSIRLSFGNKFETSPSPIKSPTFKII